MSESLLFVTVGRPFFRCSTQKENAAREFSFVKPYPVLRALSFYKEILKVFSNMQTFVIDQIQADAVKVSEKCYRKCSQLRSYNGFTP